MNEDIIVAVATSRLEAAISMLRISGKDCISFVQEFFTGKILEKQTHTITYGFIEDDNKKIDEVMVSIYRGKRSFTGEEMVEISCHGGVYITQMVLETCLKHGARIAERGEFSKRAFLNGRIDLSQAESISDLITAKSSYASSLALQGIDGSIRHFVEDLKEELIQIITQIEVNIDYPEYDDVEELTSDSLLPKSISLKEKMDKILEDSKNVRLMKDGIQTVIIGRPNVGKSSLLNALLKEDKAIVSDIAGTTRDVVEGNIRIDDILLNMIDTAGIRKTDNMIESIGVEKAKEVMKQADLILLVFDASTPFTKEDQELYDLTENMNRIIILNKIDLGKVIDIEGIEISAKQHDVLLLTRQIKELFQLGKITDQHNHVLTNARQTNLLYQASIYLKQAIDAMNMGIPTDLIVEDLYACWLQLKDILGQRAKEDLLDELFKRFCIGK
ncbi:tRNA uridine-5-carboxymethylaminomethyl(34) synthesis GTPase MnmE [Tannockella kyphosi]|uniref:tRNA uridine-5-carboxymethylaminomethyl(34) synthesis GTPase MnmE n=1 Tax=Tannockella kyphosi TaxID=2899121 RepID=UPI00201370B7|nr:tRNA uridine-5-carboxymethylaminomethyl(34) synthesis GTPase MnmE [Tannockella kyphosi]